MSHQERIACILWFTWKAGWHAHVMSRLGRDIEPRVPVPSDEEISDQWDDLDEEERNRFIRAAGDFVR